MEHDLVSILNNTINQHGYKTWQMEDNKWIFNEDGLECLTCSSGNSTSDQSYGRDRSQRGEGMIFEMTDFTRIEADGNMEVVVTNEEGYYVEVQGRKRYTDKVYVKKMDDVLYLELDNEKFGYLKSDGKHVKIIVSLPDLESIKGRGAVDFDVSDFTLDDFYISLSGASRADIEVDSDQIDMDLKGASSLSISGKATGMDADISGASSLRAYDLSVNSISIEASGASNAKVNAKDKLYVDASGMSSVRYKGRPSVTIEEESGMSSVRRSY